MPFRGSAGAVPIEVGAPRSFRHLLERGVFPLGVVAIVSLALEFGFYVSPVPVALLHCIQLLAVGLYATCRLLHVCHAPRRWVALRGLWLDGVILAGAGVVVLLGLEFSAAPFVAVSAVYVATLQVALGVRVVVKAVQLNLLLSQRVLQPTRFVVSAFVMLIAIGTLALALPRATSLELWQADGFSLFRHLLNCAFTATSATCVTGLAVYDTATDFTLFGQAIILIMIQLGGLGIMVIGSVLGILAGRQLSLRHSLVLQDETSHNTLGEMRGLVTFIVLSTLAIEVVGAVVLWPMFEGVSSAGERLFFSVFHSVSAFCNAGFSLQSDSLIAFRRAWPVYFGIMPLIVVGGLGFPVLRDLWHGLREWSEAVWHGRTGVQLGAAPRKRVLSLHSHVVLVASAWLVVVPTGMFLVFETFSGGVSVLSDGSADAMGLAGFPERLFDAAFLSVTCRTAGFNTVAMDSESLTPASHMLAALLMFIGGSPGSTAGGVKTASLAVMALGVWATLRGRQHVEVFGRRIPEVIVRRSGALFVVMAALISVVTLLLCFTEGVTLRVGLFESVSAAGTVGLSAGLTPELTGWGRLVIMLTMLAGRLGPLTVLVAMAGTPRTLRYEYPTEAVIIG